MTRLGSAYQRYIRGGEISSIRSALVFALACDALETDGEVDTLEPIAENWMVEGMGIVQFCLFLSGVTM